jgi:Arc/MetJ-type ribon-helix-helix transcriptional regulator
MPPKRIMLTVTPRIDQFLERMVEETGIDRSNLIRTRLWEWMREEQDRSIAERQLKKDLKQKQPRG